MKIVLWLYVFLRICLRKTVRILGNSRGKMCVELLTKRGWHGEIFKGYPDVVDVDTLCEMLGGISRKLAYRLLGSGEIESVRIGRSYKIPKVCVCNYLFAKR